MGAKNKLKARLRGYNKMVQGKIGAYSFSFDCCLIFFKRMLELSILSKSKLNFLFASFLVYSIINSFPLTKLALLNPKKHKDYADKKMRSRKKG